MLETTIIYLLGGICCYVMFTYIQIVPLTKCESFLIDRLRELYDNPVQCDCAGICNYLKQECQTRPDSPNFDALLVLFQTHTKSWKHFSGNIVYPVCGMNTFNHHLYNNSLWLGKQGELRQGLIKHVIKEITK